MFSRLFNKLEQGCLSLIIYFRKIFEPGNDENIPRNIEKKKQRTKLDKKIDTSQPVLRRRSRRIKKRYSSYILNTPPTSDTEDVDLKTAIMLSQVSAEMNTDNNKNTEDVVHDKNKSVEVKENENRDEDLVGCKKDENEEGSEQENIKTSGTGSGSEKERASKDQKVKEKYSSQTQESERNVKESTSKNETYNQKINEKETGKIEIENDHESDDNDEYTKLLKHSYTCMVKVDELIKFRMHDRNATRVNGKTYLKEMVKYIPIQDPIMMAVDLEDGSAILWEGNHRITCASNMKFGQYPEYVRVKFFITNLQGEVNYLGMRPRLKIVPKELQMWTCDCHFGLKTNCN